MMRNMIEDVVETPRTTKSASYRKLRAAQCQSEESCSSLEEEEEPPINCGFRLIDLTVLAQIFEWLLCPVCKSNVTLVEDLESKMGFATALRICCTKATCKFSKPFFTSTKNGQFFEVNRRTVLAAREIGVGYKGLVKFSGVLNMPLPMSKNAYRGIVKSLESAAEHVAERSMAVAASETKENYEAEIDGVADIGVSGDGTWRKRGFKSSIGIHTIMSIVSGKILDIEIMSKECRACLINKRKEGTPEFDEWWEDHQHECHINFHGSSGKMDPAGCVSIFNRSIDKHACRYTEFLGDGDCKAHNQLIADKVYGGKEVKKLECIGHIQKRMGSRLRSLKKRWGTAKLTDGKSIGGKGRLTDKLIDSLQVYYGKAIRANCHSVPEMKDAVMAIWNHTKSTDKDPYHHLCPTGKDSWCGFQRDIANGTSSYKHNPLPTAVANEIKATFVALSDDNLLNSCLHGGTQNQNECFNALIWQRAPKTSHSGLTTVQLAAYLAIGHFNDGCKTITSVLEEQGINPGYHCVKLCQKADKERLYQSVYKSTDRAKQRRRAIRNQKKGFSEQLEEKEGPQYQSGAF